MNETDRLREAKFPIMFMYNFLQKETSYHLGERVWRGERGLAKPATFLDKPSWINHTTRQLFIQDEPWHPSGTTRTTTILHFSQIDVDNRFLAAEIQIQNIFNTKITKDYATKKKKKSYLFVFTPKL